MKTLYLYIIKLFLPILIISIFFIVFMLELFDLFNNLNQYIDRKTPIFDILHIALLYLPTCLSYALPVSLLFSISFTLGNLYAQNELIAVYGAGISLYRLVIPFITIGLLLSIFMFFFENHVVIPSRIAKDEKTSIVLQRNSEVNIISNKIQRNLNTNTVYKAREYNNKKKTIRQLTVFEWDDNDNFIKRIEADSARWTDNYWEMNNCVVYFWDEATGIFAQKQVNHIAEPKYNQLPESFVNSKPAVENMQLSQASDFIAYRKAAGLPYRVALMEYYKRFSFAFTCFIVALLSCSVGSKFKKNILLMSLLSSLLLSIGYFVVYYATDIMAAQGGLPPLAGAWLGTFIYLTAGIIMLRFNKT